MHEISYEARKETSENRISESFDKTEERCKLRSASYHGG
jgi:hypothetical protein